MHMSGQLARIRVNLYSNFALMHISPGYIAQWLERLTADQQVLGSNPGVPSTYSCAFLMDDVGHPQWHHAISLDIA